MHCQTVSVHENEIYFYLTLSFIIDPSLKYKRLSEDGNQATITDAQTCMELEIKTNIKFERLML